MAGPSTEITLNIPSAENSFSLAVGTASVQSAVFPLEGYINYFCDQHSWVEQDVNPTATTGHQFVPANTLVRMGPVAKGNKIAVRAAAAGTAYIGKEM